MYFLDAFGNEIFGYKKQAEELAKQGKNDGVKAWSQDKQWFLYLNLLPGQPDPHSEALEEPLNPATRNWDDFMLAKEEIGKYQIIYSIQDYYFCELGDRKKFKKYALMHFTKNTKHTDSTLINFCFTSEEMAKSKLINCRLRAKTQLISKGIKLLKAGMLSFRDYRSRDWFLEQIKSK
ncbi:MAG: hypothetical protein MRERV_49c001 [Mycoplasmataceae bacterium RV_VA103A]|nr:MAG: hypothetical protein MRERV_49c001 [Mycoplasmataceae bacterium RV_VA103A]